MENYITLEDLKDFEVWKSWRNGGLELEPLYNEKEVRQMLFDLGDVLFDNCQNGIEEGEPESYFDVIIESFKK